MGPYYFPGWPSREKWQVLTAFPERTPMLGYYRKGDPTVLDHWIAQYFRQPEYSTLDGKPVVGTIDADPPPRWHPDKFRDMLRSARAFADPHPVAKRKKLVPIEAWNEYGDGAVIEPHREWGVAYLDAVLDLVGVTRGRHQDLSPGDLRLTVPPAP